MKIILRTRSHRARAYLDRVLGYHPQYYWTWEAGAVFCKVTEDEYKKIKEAKIKGITKARVKEDDLRQCWTRGKEYDYA